MMTSAFGAPSIKVEGAGPEVGQGSAIKIEPGSAGASPAGLEDDIYEDAGDLDFTQANQAAYLTRIPKWLWEAWSKLEDDADIQIGTIRVEGAPGGIKRMSMLLTPEATKGKNVPKEYNMHMTNQDSTNTFLFSEKDLPGFKSFAQNQHYSRTDAFMGKNRVGKKRKGAGEAIRRTVPKQTSLLGQVRTELNCLPVENLEYQQIMEERARLTLKPRKETQLVSGGSAASGGSLLMPGTLGAPGDFKSFVNKTGPPRGKKQLFKAARMPQNELLDLIYDCFREYTYWPMRSLKERLKQPEVYLKETLEMVAMMNKSGPHALQWQLKPEAREMRYAEIGFFDKVKDEAAPEVEEGTGLDGMDEMDEDDDNVDMEDVPLQ